MPVIKLAILERLGIAIAQSDDAKKRVMELRNANRSNLYAILLRYVREGWLKHDEFYTLLPSNEDASASEVRDILLAVFMSGNATKSKAKNFSNLKRLKD